MINKLRDLLYKAGIFDDDAQLLGQWKPDTYNRYIEVHLEYTGIHNVSLRPQTFSSHDTTPKTTHPVPLILGRPLAPPPPLPVDGALGSGACGPGRGRARDGLWGGLPRRVPPAWAPMRPPRRGPGPARLPACGNPRNGMRKRRRQEDRRIWKDRSM